MIAGLFGLEREGRARLRAVATREMRSLARHRAPFVLRTVYAALVAGGAGILVLGGDSGWSGARLAELGYRAFFTVVWIQSPLAVLMGVALGVVSIASERRDRTLGLLRLSQLQPPDVVLGKLVALLALLASILLAGLPIYALVGWAGGLDYAWLVRLAILTAVLAVLGISAGLAAGLATTGAFTGFAAAMAFLLAPLVVALVFASPSGPQNPIVQLFATAPLAIAGVAAQEEGAVSFGLRISILLALCVWALHYAIRIFPRAAAVREGAGLRGLFEKLDRFFEDINVGGIRFGKDGPRRARGNAVAWLTRTTSGTALPRYGFRIISAVTVVSLLALPFLFIGSSAAQWTMNLFAAAMFPALAALGAQGLGEEKGRRSLNVLLATPLTPAAILRGKILAALPLILSITLIPIGIFFFAHYSVYGRVEPGAWRAVGILLGEGLCAYMLALAFSIHVPNALRAGLLALLALVAFHLAGGVVMVWTGNGRDAEFWGLTGMVAMAVCASFLRQVRERPLLELALYLAIAAAVTGLGAVYIVNRGTLEAMESMGYFTAAMPVALAVLVFFQGVRSFDRSLGRTP